MTGTTTSRRAIQLEARTDRRTLLGAGGAAVLAATISRPDSMTAQEASPTATTGPILVYPPHRTVTASPGTEISIRGARAADLGVIEVIGSESGGHSGVFHDHGDELGTSFVPDAPFFPGEEVKVRAEVPLRDGSEGPFVFQVAVPAAPVVTPPEPEQDEPATPPLAFRSRPDLRPPVIDITENAGDLEPGFLFLGAKVTGSANGAMILDNDGGLVWFGQADHDVIVHNDVRVQEYQGDPVLTHWEGMANKGTGFGHLVMLSQGYERIATIQVGNGYPGIDQHEGVLTERGTMLCIVYNPVQWDLSGAGGVEDDVILDGVIQEIEIATGRVVFEWHSLDHIDLEEAIGTPKENAAEPWDYVHLNSVEELENGDLIVSARHTNAIYRIERTTGDIAWRLNGTASDFEMGEGTPFAYQHDARLHPDGRLSLFDNAAANQADDADLDSRGMMLQLDEEAMVATLVQEYVHPTGVLSVSQGNMQVLDSGNVLVGWGNAPVFTEMSESGEVLLNGRFPKGGSSYRAYRFPWSGVPATPPAVVIEREADEVVAYVSWNGATDVATWEVLAGESDDSLEAIAEAPRDGFETAIPIPTSASRIQVQALDASGAELGRSAALDLPA